MADATTEPSGDPETEPAPRKREPIINAPLIVIGMTLALIGLYALFFFSSYDEQVRLEYNFALAPRRFWAQPGSEWVYPDMLSGLLTLFSTALLHANWMHVIVNSLMLLAFGTPVARAFGADFTGAGKWMIVFLGSVLVGSIFYLAIRDANAPAAVGASGGTSGLVAAALLLDLDGRKRALWSREFLMMTAAFAAANAVLTLIGPYALGMELAWEAHLGGYIAGAVLMAVLPARGYRVAKA